MAKWDGEARLHRMVNESFQELRTVRSYAHDVAEKGSAPSSLFRLRQIQGVLATAPACMQGRMHWLVLVMVKDRPDCHKSLRGMMAALPRSDFSVYHYDSHSAEDATYLAFARQRWYQQGRVVHRGFVVGSGCTVEAMKDTIAWMLDREGAGRYTHLWKIDSDVQFGLFNYDAFHALVAHRAPYLCQPAIVPRLRGKRSTDRASLRAQLAPIPTPYVFGRQRLLSRTMPPKDDVEIMCPLIDARILPVVAAAIAPMDTRNDIVASEAINTIAQAFANASSGTGRPAGLVFDYVPLIHDDTRLLGWGSRTLKRKNETKCPRSRLDGYFGQGEHPRHGKWQAIFDDATKPGTDFEHWVHANAATPASTPTPRRDGAPSCLQSIFYQ